MASSPTINRLLMRYPEVFTVGFFSRKGPSRRQVADSKFTCTLVAKGWESEEPDCPPNKTVVVKITGPEFGYDATSRLMIQAGITVLLESDKMPFNGGVLPPGFAFYKTSIFERIQRHGIKVEVVQNT